MQLRSLQWHKMKVKMLESVAGFIGGRSQALAKGQVVDLATDEAKDLIKSGHAQQVKATRKNDNKKQPNRK